jgi:hypothetical protein
MEYAKLLQQSAGKFDYRESPLKTTMKINELKKTINKDGRANIIKEEPYANRIATYLTKEELNRRINAGARQYLAGVYDFYNDKQLKALGNTKEEQEAFLKEARKQTQIMKLLRDPAQIEYLKKVDPVGLFFLEQSNQQNIQAIKDASADPTGENLRNLIRGLPLNLSSDTDSNSLTDSFSLPSRTLSQYGLTQYGLTQNAQDAISRLLRSTSSSQSSSTESPFSYRTQSPSMTTSSQVSSIGSTISPSTASSTESPFSYLTQSSSMASSTESPFSYRTQSPSTASSTESPSMRTASQVSSIGSTISPSTASSTESPFSYRTQSPSTASSITTSSQVQSENLMDAPVPSLRDRPIHPSDLPIVMQNADELQELNPELNRVEAERLASQNVNEAIGLAQAGLSYYNPISQQATITTSNLVPQSTVVSSKPQKEFPTLIPSSSKKVKELLKETIKQLKESPTVEDVVRAQQLVEEVNQKVKSKKIKQADLDELLQQAEEIHKLSQPIQFDERPEDAFATAGKSKSKTGKKYTGKVFVTTEGDLYEPIYGEESSIRPKEMVSSKAKVTSKANDLRQYVTAIPEDAFATAGKSKSKTGKKQTGKVFATTEGDLYEPIYGEESSIRPKEMASSKSLFNPQLNPQQVIEVGSYRPELVFQDNRVIDRQTGKRITKDNLINLISQFRKGVANESMNTRELLTTYNIVSGKAGLQARANYPQLVRIKTKQQQKEYADLYNIPYDENESIKDFKVRVSGFATGEGFKPLSSHPNHIISGIMHFVTHKNRMINRNEYNRENAQNLIQEASEKAKGEGFFSDLKDKLGMWLFKNVHPAGRMMTYVQESMKK